LAIQASGLVVWARTLAANFTFTGSPLRRIVNSRSCQPSALSRA
jgi:hypothetical protein